MGDVTSPLEIRLKPPTKIIGSDSSSDLSKVYDYEKRAPQETFEMSTAFRRFEMAPAKAIRRYQPSGSRITYLAPERRAALFDKSRHMEQLDIFISHSWASGGWSKALSLFLQSGCKFALACWIFGLVLAAAMCHADLLPLPFTFAANHAKFSEICPFGPWAMIFGFLGTFIGLVLSPYSPRCKPLRDVCFIDVACIHQSDESVMKRGIRGIAAFLSVSRELRILWSPVYLSRLWCVFEVATYKKLNPNGKVVVAPIFLETIVMILYSSTLLGSFAYFAQRQESGSYVAAPALISALAPFLISIHCLRRNYAQKHELFSQFENFDLDAVHCLSECDRDFIWAAISELYGSKEAFTSYVRGSLREELLGPMTRSPGPQKYGLLIASPVISLLIDCIVALWKGGAPADVVLLYGVMMVLVGACLSNNAGFNLLVLLCDHFAEPLLPSLDWLQTSMIFVVFVLYFVLSSLLVLYASSAHRWEFLPGLALGFGFILLTLKWLQRKSDARRLTSKRPAA